MSNGMEKLTGSAGDFLVAGVVQKFSGRRG